jgi:hypothetical protein
MIHFNHRLSTTEEINLLKQYCLTHGDTLWNPSSFSGQVADNVYYEYWSSNHNAMNILHLPEKYHISILDDGVVDTCVLGQGWEVLSVHNTRRANVLGFDNEAAVKWNLPIVSAITAVDLPNGISVRLIVHEGIYNNTANHSLLSEFQLRGFVVKIDSTALLLGGSQKMVIQDVGI